MDLLQKVPNHNLHSQQCQCKFHIDLGTRWSLFHGKCICAHNLDKTLLPSYRTGYDGNSLGKRFLQLWKKIFRLIIQMSVNVHFYHLTLDKLLSSKTSYLYRKKIAGKMKKLDNSTCTWVINIDLNARHSFINSGIKWLFSA